MTTLPTTLRCFVLTAVLALGAAALAQGQHGPGHAHGARDDDSATRSGSGMGMGMGGPHAAHAADEAGFLSHMIPHHQEAIDAARALLEVTERPALRALAEAIIASQSAEIEAMQAWLDAWHPDAPRDMAYEPMMRDLGPGAAADAVERAFLEDMVMHHMMAVRDARMLLMQGAAEHEEVATLARSIVTEQLAEIDQMRAWLVEWFGVTMPMGPMLDAAGVGAGNASMGPGMMGDGMGMMHGGMGPGMMHGGSGMGMHGPHGGAHGHHGGTGGTLVDADAAARLAQAFLDGRGAGTVTGVEEPVITYEVRFDDADGGGVLIVDARTGTVRLAAER